MNTKQFSLLLGKASYWSGVAAGLFLIFVAVWADMESSLYGFPRLANTGLGGLHCPILLTPEEAGTISLNVSNPTEGRISPAIKILISTPILPQESLESLQLAPGESKRLQWSVGPENVDLRRFIFAKVLLYSAYPLPSRETSCGIFILDLPGRGPLITSLLVALSLLGMGWGLYAIQKNGAEKSALSPWRGKQFGAMVFLAFMIVLGLLICFAGNWLIALVVLVLALLTIVILLGARLLGEGRGA